MLMLIVLNHTCLNIEVVLYATINASANIIDVIQTSF